VELKVAILEWFSTCVETQPGAIEVLLNIDIVHDSTSGHKVSFFFSFVFCFFQQRVSVFETDPTWN